MEISTEILTAIGSAAVGIGGAVKWMLMRFDAKMAALQESEKTAREALETALTAQIDGLRNENERLSKQMARYIRHVGVLEGMLRQAGIQVPAMEVEI